jgi:hypothetical protein
VVIGIEIVIEGAESEPGCDDQDGDDSNPPKVVHEFDV